MVNPLSENLFSPYADFLWLIPMIVLIFGGILASVRFGRTSRLSYAVANGTSVLVGYGLLAVVGSFVFASTSSGFFASTKLQPALGSTVLFMGVTYPVFFGGLGGLIYFLAQGRVSLKIQAR